jgi:tRNA-dihydrouridine synthase
MRRHYANYLKGIINIKPLRTQLVTMDTAEEIEEALNNFILTYKEAPCSTT